MILTTEPQTAEMDGYEEVMMVELPEGVPEVAESGRSSDKAPSPTASSFQAGIEPSGVSLLLQGADDNPRATLLNDDGGKRRAKTEVQVDEPPMSPLIASSLASCKRRFALSWSPQG